MITLNKKNTQVDELMEMKEKFDNLKKKTTNIIILFKKCEPLLKEIKTLYGYAPTHPVGTLGYSLGTKSNELLTEIEKIKDTDLLTEIEKIKNNESKLQRSH